MVETLFANYCVDCHDASSDSGLDLTEVSYDVSQSKVFGTWVSIHDRLRSGEMPPEGVDRPNDEAIRESTQVISSALLSREQQKIDEVGRVGLRRLSRSEFENAVNDLLHINAELAGILPEENASGFDTIASNQGVSTQHIKAYLKAADVAMDHALRFEPRSDPKSHRVYYRDHPAIRKHIDENEDGHVVIGETKDAAIMFSDASYLYKFPDFHVDQDGWFEMRVSAYAVQCDGPQILTLNRGDYRRGFSETVRAFDVMPNSPEEFHVPVYLRKGQYIFPSVANLETPPDGRENVWNLGAENYRGAGIAIQWMEVRGPLNEEWPPKSTSEITKYFDVHQWDQPKWNHEKQSHLQYALEFDQTLNGPNFPDLPEADQNRIRRGLERLVTDYAGQAFRRQPTAQEVDEMVVRAIKELAGGCSMVEAVRVCFRSILTSPHFLFLQEEPGPLADQQLAARLSLFLTRSLPDSELREIAEQKRLVQPAVLTEQVERMLNGPFADRFIRDFAGQWLQVNEIDATSPDSQLYPEFDDLLKRAMVEETVQFFAHLLREDLSTDCLIDSNFLFVNRRLAEHYGIDGVRGQELRRIDKPKDSPRGGLLTQAAILKITANGTTTSPVRRGAWILDRLLGTPPSPPPPAVGSIEPDTRGATTIRELLDKHRSSESCNRCHREIDPPGFALECFDVIGGYRRQFRSLESGERPKTKLHGRPIWQYKLASPVDSSGEFSDGRTFRDIHEFKQHLLAQRRQVAQCVAEKLTAFATGAEIGFADRREIQRILDKCDDREFGLRSIVHAVVQSPLFMSK